MSINDDQRGRFPNRTQVTLDAPQVSPRIVQPGAPHIEQKGLQASPRIQTAKPTASIATGQTPSNNTTGKK